MGKAIEETWTVYNGRFVVDIAQEDSDDAWWAEFDSKDATAEDAAGDRAKLAAAAPEMARMLLAREWDTTQCSEPSCSSCLSRQEWGGHADDCEWLAIMRKAGVE